MQASLDHDTRLSLSMGNIIYCALLIYALINLTNLFYKMTLE